MIGTFENLKNAILVGANDIVEDALTAGADINGMDQNGWSPLMYAVFHSREAIVKLLLDRGADVGHKNPDEFSSLMLASLQGFSRIASLLLEKGADANFRARNGWTPLMSVSLKGHLDVVKVLIEGGADLNLIDSDGMNALMFACQKGNNKEVVELLIEKGADVNATNNHGLTALAILYLAEQGNDGTPKPWEYAETHAILANAVIEEDLRRMKAKKLGKIDHYEMGPDLRHGGPLAQYGEEFSDSDSASQGKFQTDKYDQLQDERMMRPCERCGQLKSGFTCPHCGHTQWGAIVGGGILSGILLAIAFFLGSQSKGTLETVAQVGIGILGIIIGFGTLISINTALKTPKKRLPPK